MEDVSNSKIMTLNDGRNLGFSDSGDPNGKPIIYFHGFPGSRLETQRFNQVALANNYRLITMDRPGMGLSSLDRNRTILSTVNDMITLADYLKIDRFSVMGHSGGGPFVAACAYLIPQRITGAAIVSGMSSFINPETHVGMVRAQLFASKLVKIFPPLATLMMKITRMMLNKSDKLLEKMIKPLPLIDQNIFRDPVSGKELIQSTLEAFRNGVAGTAYEMKILLNDWGFKLEDIICPVSIWHGAKDSQVPISNAKLYAKLITNSSLHIFEDDGHHSLIKNHFVGIVETL